MDSGVSFAPSFTATHPMIPTHFMGTDPSAFHNGMQNYNTQSAPWVSSHFSVDMPSPVKSSPWPTYMNPSIGSGGTMALMPTSLFDITHVPMGGWNLPPYGSNASYALPGASAQMGTYPTYYAPSMYLSSAMLVPSNTFSMTGPQVHFIWGESILQHQRVLVKLFSDSSKNRKDCRVICPFHTR
jgi:hypothetical protein